MKVQGFPSDVHSVTWLTSALCLPTPKGPGRLEPFFKNQYLSGAYVHREPAHGQVNVGKSTFFIDLHEKLRQDFICEGDLD